MIEAVAKFEKVSWEQFLKDCTSYRWWGKSERELKELYEKIKLPERATTGSAGYDFFMPYDLIVEENNAYKIPTGIKCKMKLGWVLCEFPRSGLGFKYGLSMANTVGIIDSDYYNSDNEGHIFIKLVNEGILSNKIEFKAGDSFCQGIFLPFGITNNDNANGIRNGGFGSTDKRTKIK